MAGSYVQVNSALEYPSGGTLFSPTVTTAVSPISISGLSTSVELYGPVGVGVISVGGGVAEGVGVGVEDDESNVFKSGLYKPTVIPSFVNVVLLKNEY
jgi:hypothetical protein